MHLAFFQVNKSQEFPDLKCALDNWVNENGFPRSFIDLGFAHTTYQYVSPNSVASITTSQNGRPFQAWYSSGKGVPVKNPLTIDAYAWLTFFGDASKQEIAMRESLHRCVGEFMLETPQEGVLDHIVLNGSVYPGHSIYFENPTMLF